MFQQSFAVSDSEVHHRALEHYGVKHSLRSLTGTRVAAMRKISGQMRFAVEASSTSASVPPAERPKAAPQAKSPQAESSPKPLEGLGGGRTLSGLFLSSVWE